MENELGKCCRCGEEIGPYDRENEADWLCKQCYDDTHKGRRRPTPRMNGHRIPTYDERRNWNKWQEEIDERIDREMSAKGGSASGMTTTDCTDDTDYENGNNCAGVPARLPKRPLVGTGCV